jgi:DNA polymerase-3 subunit delta
MIYFIFGEDSYRSKKKLTDIIEEYKKVHKSGLNLIYIDTKKKDFKELSDNFKIVSMFSEKKLIVLKNLFSAKGGPAVGWQEEFLKNIKDTENIKDIIVVYEDGAVDQRTKFFKTLQKHAKCQEFKFLQPAMLKKWMAFEFEKNKTKIDFEAQNLLVTFVGNDLWQMANEINKLSNYKRGGDINKQDVELLIRPNIENDIFKTIDALASKNKKQALTLLHKHIKNGDNPLYLLSMIAYQFKNLLIIKELIDAKNSYAIVTKKSGLHPFVVKKSFYLCDQFTMPELKKIYQKIFQVDSDIKIGKIEAETALDLLVSSI